MLPIEMPPMSSPAAPADPDSPAAPTPAPVFVSRTEVRNGQLVGAPPPAPTFKYWVVIRKKAERAALPGETCQFCHEFAMSVTRGTGMKPSEYVQRFSRHRHLYQRSDTPPGFWNLSFPQTPPRAPKKPAPVTVGGAVVAAAPLLSTSQSSSVSLSLSLKPQAPARAPALMMAVMRSPTQRQQSEAGVEDTPVRVIENEAELLQELTQDGQHGDVDPSDVLLFLTNADARDFGLTLDV